jgi:hypothetical protein
VNVVAAVCAEATPATPAVGDAQIAEVSVVEAADLTSTSGFNASATQVVDDAVIEATGSFSFCAPLASEGCRATPAVVCFFCFHRSIALKDFEIGACCPFAVALCKNRS